MKSHPAGAYIYLCRLLSPIATLLALVSFVMLLFADRAYALPFAWSTTLVYGILCVAEYRLARCYAFDPRHFKRMRAGVIVWLILLLAVVCKVRLF